MRPTRPTPDPISVNVPTVIAAGTAVWFVAFLVLAVADGASDRTWTCLAGWTLGLVGVALSWMQDRARQRHSRDDGSP